MSLGPLVWFIWTKMKSLVFFIFFLEAETLRVKSANPNSPFLLRNKDAPSTNYHAIIIRGALWAGLAVNMPALLLSARYCDTAVTSWHWQTDEIKWLKCIYKDNVSRSVLFPRLRVCSISLTLLLHILCPSYMDSLKDKYWNQAQFQQSTPMTQKAACKE